MLTFFKVGLLVIFAVGKKMLIVTAYGLTSYEENQQKENQL
jgi:hypothetical protein